MEKSKIYRPEWTCGKYNKDKHVAIMYNLIEGVSHFFESYSADVIGCILENERNVSIDISTIVNKTGIAEESINDFIDKLVDVGLLTFKLYTKEEINSLRKQVGERNIQKEQRQKAVHEKLPFYMENAEMDYSNAIESPKTISSVMFELTYNCSEKCIHCYNPGATRNDIEESKRSNRKELNLEDYKKIIDELDKLGVFKVCLSGGDPFSKPIVWDIIDYLYKKEIAFDVFTNGQSITKDVKRLADYYPRLVGISIYSAIEKDHEAITRVKGSLKKSLSVMEELSSLGVSMNLKCPIMQTNLKSYFTVKQLAKKYGAVPQFEVCLTDSLDGDVCVSKHLRLNEEQLEVVLRDADVPLYIGKEAPSFGGQKRNMNKNVCGAGESSFCITPEGNVQPCCAFPTSFGNVKEESLSSILANNNNLYHWRGFTLKDYEKCGKEDYCDYCNLCPGNNFIANQTPLKASDNNCFIAKTRYNLAQKIKKGYDPLKDTALEEKLQSLKIDNISLNKQITQDNRDKEIKG